MIQKLALTTIVVVFATTWLASFALACNCAGP